MKDMLCIHFNLLCIDQNNNELVWFTESHVSQLVILKIVSMPFWPVSVMPTLYVYMSLSSAVHICHYAHMTCTFSSTPLH